MYSLYIYTSTQWISDSVHSTNPVHRHPSLHNWPLPFLASSFLGELLVNPNQKSLWNPMKSTYPQLKPTKTAWDWLQIKSWMAECCLLTKQVLVVDSYFHYDLMPTLNGNQTFLEVFFLFGSSKSLQAVLSPMKLQDFLNMTMGSPASSKDFLH